MPGGKCVFNIEWLEKDSYKDWLLTVPDNRHKAKCSMCLKVFDISNMGEPALKYHMKGMKHQNNVKSAGKKLGLKNFFTTQEERPSYNLPSTSFQNLPKPVSVINLEASIDLNNLVTKAEILWALKVMNSHYSYKSCEDVSDIFKTMFSDSQVAKHFSCGEKKTTYLTVFGIAPYFASLLKSRVKEESKYVLLFDESLNHTNQSKQLDCHVRFWEGSQINSRYYSSDYLGHATSELLFDKINEKCMEIGTKGLVQLAMDGPNVNLKVLDMIMVKMKAEHNTCLLNIGSCGLHIVHNAFRDGCTIFNEVEEAASAAYWFFKDSPARREDFAAVNPDLVKYPKKFCKHRWVENEIVLVRLLEILPAIKNYFKEIENKKFAKPTNKSYGILQNMIKDELFLVKCNFILSVVKDVESFLRLYQTDKPMLPFLNGDLYCMVKSLLKKFVIEDKIPISSYKMIGLDLEDKAIYKDASKIDIGFIAKKELKNLNKSNFKNDKKIMEFYLNCREFLLKLCKKLIEKCPLNFSLVRNACFLDPRTLISSKEANLKKFESILLYFTNAGQVPEKDCDQILKEYGSFIADFNGMDAATRFKHCADEFFNPSIDRLDIFYYEFLSNGNYPNLWNIVKTLLLLSHGQASVERGFSINKNLLVENLGNETLSAKRTIDDHVRFVGGIKKVNISKELIVSVAGARQKYLSYLEQNKLSKANKTMGEKRKLLNENVEILKKKKRLLEDDIRDLTETSEKYSEEAEKKSDLKLISKANALRHHAKDKMVELKTCEEELNNMYLTLKNA